MHLLQTNVGRLRILGFLEGLSLLLPVFVAMPLKYGWGDPSLTQILGPIHGTLFLLFVLHTLGVGIAQKWVFRSVTRKVLPACAVPFGTFYIDKKIPAKIPVSRKWPGLLPPGIH